MENKSRFPFSSNVIGKIISLEAPAAFVGDCGVEMSSKKLFELILSTECFSLESQD